MANEKFYWEKPLWYCRVIVWSNNRRLQAIQRLFLSNWLKTTAREKQQVGGSSATFAHHSAFKSYPEVSKPRNSFLKLCLIRFSFFIYMPKPPHLKNIAQRCSLALAALYGHWNTLLTNWNFHILSSLLKWIIFSVEKREQLSFFNAVWCQIPSSKF